MVPLLLLLGKNFPSCRIAVVTGQWLARRRVDYVLLGQDHLPGDFVEKPCLRVYGRNLKMNHLEEERSFAVVWKDDQTLGWDTESCARYLGLEDHEVHRIAGTGTVGCTVAEIVVPTDDMTVRKLNLELGDHIVLVAVGS
jgi:hypothetical protein